jgi:serpin B
MAGNGAQTGMPTAGLHGEVTMGRPKCTALAALLSYGMALQLGGCGTAQDETSQAAARLPAAQASASDVLGTMQASLGATKADAAALARLEAGTLRLTVELLGALARNDSHNVVFSPYGVVRALGLLQLGARGRTADQLAALVWGEPDGAALLAAHAAVRRALEDEARRFRAHTQLLQADAVWGAANLRPSAPFAQAAATAFEDAWHTVDFAGAPTGARDTINRWVCEHTGGQVHDLLARGTPAASTRLLLTSTLFVFAPWARPFHASSVRTAPFYGADGHARAVPNLHGDVRAKYAQVHGWVALDLPYKATGLSLTLLWPQQGELAEAQRHLDVALLQQIWAALAPQNVALSLPKFHIEACHNIKEALVALGAHDAFAAGEADLSGIDAGQTHLYVEALLHRATLEVNERGTQASAASGIVLRPTSVPEHIQPVAVERPFLFFMRDRTAQTLLLAGRVATLGD